MSHVVLVHGAWHDTWCWDPLVAALADRGCRATAVHLPSDEVGAGAEAYAAAIAAAVEPTGSMVVGHSLAGLALPLVPALAPVTALVYLASLLPEPGRSWRDQLAAGRPMAPWFYAHGLPRQGHDDQGRSTWPADVASELFFHDCETEVAAAAAPRLRPQAPTPVTETTPLTAFPDVPTTYVMCRDDRAVSPEWAAAVVPERLRVEPVWVEGGHSPFLARPHELADLLLEVGDVVIHEHGAHRP
jgi:hypothetical protein